MTNSRIVLAAGLLLATVTCRGCRETPPARTTSSNTSSTASLGTEETVGVPYWIWRVLPIVFADKLPNRPGTGWERLGFIQEAPASRSADWHDARQREFGVELVGSELCDLSCRDDPRNAGLSAADRAGHAREPDGPAGLCALSDGGAPGSALHGVEAHRGDRESKSRLRIVESLAYRFVADASDAHRHPRSGEGERMVRHPAAAGPWPRRHVQSLQGDVRLRHVQGRHRGHGRPALALESADPRRGMWLHWDGNNDSVEERNKSAAIGAGATPESLDLAALGRGSRTGSWI